MRRYVLEDVLRRLEEVERVAGGLRMPQLHRDLRRVRDTVQTELWRIERRDWERWRSA